jgi:hypothetical protein
VIETLLESLYCAAGGESPVLPLVHGHDDDVHVRLANWNALLPTLHKAYAIDLTSDEKALIIGGGA